MPKKRPTLTTAQVLIASAAVVTVAMGIRHGVELWLHPITQAQNWSRETFALALAIQNLSWGVAGIGAGMLANRFGAFRVIVAGAALQPLGATVQVLAQNQGYQLLASVPPAQQAAAQQALQPWGLALTAQGVLRVNIQPTGQRP